MGDLDRNDAFTKIAAVDLGSNTCRLIIAKVFEDGTHENLEVFSRIVRLAENLSHSKNLENSAIERTLAVLKICARKIKEHNPSIIRCVATEACRKAGNSDIFRKLVYNTTSLDLEA